MDGRSTEFRKLMSKFNEIRAEIDFRTSMEVKRPLADLQKQKEQCRDWLLDLSEGICPVCERQGGHKDDCPLGC